MREHSGWPDETGEIEWTPWVATGNWVGNPEDMTSLALHLLHLSQWKIGKSDELFYRLNAVLKILFKDSKV